MEQNIKTSEVQKFEGSYGSWLLEQLKSIPTPMWTMFGFGAGMETVLFLTGAINLLAFVTLLGTLFGMACVCSMASGHTINGLLGAVSVIAYVTVNLSAHHYFSVLDQLFFLALIDIPLMIKWRTWGRGEDSKIKGLTIKQWSLVVVVIAVLWFLLYHLGLQPFMNENNAFWDSLALSIGAVASVLCFQRYTQTYTLWMVSNLVNLSLWFYALKDGYTQAALPMLAMTLFYTASAVYGRFFAIWNGKNNK